MANLIGIKEDCVISASSADEIIALTTAQWKADPGSYTAGGRVSVTAGNTLSGKHYTRTPREAILLYFLNASLREEKIGLVLATLDQLGETWTVTLSPKCDDIVLGMLWKKVAPRAWERFRALFRRWCASPSLDISQKGEMVAPLVHACHGVGIVCRTADPLKARGCELLAAFIAGYPRWCQEYETTEGEVAGWKKAAGEWTARCDTRCLGKAGIQELFCYIQSLITCLGDVQPVDLSPWYPPILGLTETIDYIDATFPSISLRNDPFFAAIGY